MREITKNSQIIKFIIERLPGRLGRTHLLKLIYMADYHACRLFGKPVSSFHYRWHKHGPFDDEFYNCINNLDNKYIKEEPVLFPFFTGYVFHDVPTEKIDYGLSTPEVYLLDYVIRTYGRKNLQKLLEEVVYETEPMKELMERDAYGKALPMDVVNNVDRKLYGGLDPANIIEGEKAAQEGKVRSLDEVFSAIQGRNS